MGVGMSVLIALKAMACFLIAAVLRKLGMKILSMFFLYTSLVDVMVSLASLPAINLPMLLGKNPDGTFSIWSLVIFSPYILFVRIFSRSMRLISGEEPYTEVSEGLYVGGWPHSAKSMPPGSPAVIDCTCELPRKMEFKSHPYLCIPTWDTRAPQPADIEAAVKWACRKRSQNKPVFIHCAYGHGRSVAVMCALLVAMGIVEDWKKAENFIRERRPTIRMNSLHRKALDEWSKHRLSSLKKDEGVDNANGSVLLSTSRSNMVR